MVFGILCTKDNIMFKFGLFLSGLILVIFGCMVISLEDVSLLGTSCRKESL